MGDIGVAKETKKWVLAEPIPEARRVFGSMHPVIADLLWRRGVTTEDAAKIFFEPNYERDIHDPFLFSQMQKCVDRIFFALENNQQITIHGDYDADGVTGSAVLTNTLKDLKILMTSQSGLDFYVPHREREGYGLHEPTVDILRERGTNLIITVDCGIASREPIAYAKKYGIDTIVVDHHEFPQELPEAILIHPRLPGETYPFKYLAAVGVAWKVACALYARAREKKLAVKEGAEKWLLDLVAIATVTDVMPLTGENRALESFGLKVLRRTRRLGLQKLFEVARVNVDRLDTHTIGFQIGPRINAAGRMEHAEAAFRLLISEDSDEAMELALKLHGQNIARQRESNEMFEAARLIVREQKESAVLIAVRDGWSAGLVGLVAGKLVSEFNRPVLVMGREGDRIVGSGRSIPGFDITAALREVADCLHKFGGHPQACGFTIMGEDKLIAFQERLPAIAERAFLGRNLDPVKAIDSELALEDLTLDFALHLVGFAPFGEANGEPCFLITGLRVLEAVLVGETGRHLRLLLEDTSGARQKFIAFGFGDRLDEFKDSRMIDVVTEVGINQWNGSREVQCKIVDFRLANTIN